MTGKRILPLLLCASALFGLAACGAEGESAAAPETEASAGVAVETQTVERRAISSDSTVSGTVEADDATTILVSVTAKCLETYVESGDTVEEGQILCRLDLDSTLSSYRAAQLNLSTAQQSYNDNAGVFSRQIASINEQISVTQEALALYEKTLSDTRALFDIGAASQLEVDSAALQVDQTNMQLGQLRLSLQSAVSTRNSTLNQLQTSIESARSSVQQLESALENISADGSVVAPVSGTVVSMNATKDGYVSASLPVAVINSGGRMSVDVSVSETLISKIRAGDTADVSVAALGLSFPAAVRSLEQTASAYTKLYGVTLSVPEDVTGLLSGMFAEVTFHTDGVEDAVVIPSEAILTSGAVQYVYVVEDGAARYIEVATGLTGSGVTEVTEGLEAGMELVVVGQSYLSDGEAVRVVGEG